MPVPGGSQRLAAPRRGAGACERDVRRARGDSARGLVRLLRLAQPSHEGLEQRPGHLWVLLDEGLELPGGHPAAAQVGGRDYGRRPRPAVDQSDLTEVLTGAECPDDVAADADGGVAVLDHEEADPALAL